MATKGRPPSAKTLVDRQLGRNIIPTVLPAGADFIIPNHSGDHSEGRVDSTPVDDLDIPNKKYVDDLTTDHPHQDVKTTASPNFVAVNFGFGATTKLETIKGGPNDFTNIDASETINLNFISATNIFFKVDTSKSLVWDGIALSPNADNTFDLGITTSKWKDLYLGGNANIGSLTTTGLGTFGSLTIDSINIDGGTIKHTTAVSEDFIIQNENIDEDIIFRVNNGSVREITIEAKDKKFQLVDFDLATTGNITGTWTGDDLTADQVPDHDALNNGHQDVKTSANPTFAGTTLKRVLKVESNVSADSFMTAIFGADVNANTVTDNTRKFNRCGTPHYSSGSVDATTIWFCDNNSTYNRLGIGGGNSQMKAVTELKFYTAADTTTATGTARLIIDKDGNSNFTGDLFFEGAGSGLPFAEIYARDNATTTSTSTTKTQILIFDTDGESNNCTPDHTNDHITIVKAGKYKIDTSISIQNSSGSAHVISVEMYKNDGATVFNNIHAGRTFSTGSDVGNMTMSGIVDLAVDDTIEIWITSDSASARNVTVEDIDFSAIQIGGT